MTSEHQGPERRESTREREREERAGTADGVEAGTAEGADGPDSPDAGEVAGEAGAEAGAVPAPQPEPPKYAEHVYRAPSAIAGGVVLLALAAWLGTDAVLNGSGRTPAISLAGLLLFVPVVVAYTLRPAVFANTERLRVRNPLRTITVPWPSVESLQAGYTSEVVADERTYQLWAIPVSLRARKGVQRHNARVRAGEPPARGFLGIGGQAVTSEADMVERRASSDQAIDELRELAFRHAEDGDAPAPAGRVTVRWAYEVLVPALLGAVALALLVGTR
ncbi:PH domain-containing protein [Streptomyces sp. Z26]|uniref:PH domain-containing protein n=1 Tax=Streptomyces sp. Z26 TaxID=2500177 RepID=UPI001F0BA5B6|nr:PH domain-containing protein [Streptomyces sp. Z26]